MTLADEWLALAKTPAGRATLAADLKTRRVGAGLSQLELARIALGATNAHAAVSRIEQQKLAQIPEDNLRRLATYFVPPCEPPSPPSAVWLGCLKLLQADQVRPILSEAN